MIVKIVNQEGGSDARYDVSRMTPEERAGFDGEGRPLGANNPDQYVWTPGLPGARGGVDGANMEQGGAGGGGGGAGGSGMGGPAFYDQLKALLASQSASEQSDARSAIQKALIGFGLVPEGYDDKLGAIDATTKNLIAKNTESGISYYARLMEQKKDALRSLVGRLSSTGLRRSGAKGAKLRRGQLDFDRLFQDSLSELLGQVGGVYKSYTSNEAARQMQLLSALQGYQGNVWSGQGSSVGAPAPGSNIQVGGYTVPSSVTSLNQGFGYNVPSSITSFGGGTAPASSLGGGGGLFRAQ